MTCNAKHTKFQPSDDDWKCPKCGDDSGNFAINYLDDLADEDCNLLHDADEIACGKCGYGATGKNVARALEKKTRQVPCPHCKGRGWVTKEGD